MVREKELAKSIPLYSLIKINPEYPQQPWHPQNRDLILEYLY